LIDKKFKRNDISFMPVCNDYIIYHGRKRQGNIYRLQKTPRWM